MIVSFACSVSTGIHNSHHAGNVYSTHSHEHEEKRGNIHGPHHKHNHDTDHQDNHDANHKHSHSDDNGNKDDDCCSSDFIKLQQSDRSVSRSIDVPEQTTLLLVQDLHLTLDHFLLTFAGDNFFPQHLRWPPATILDIRIAIQSFQI